MMSDRVEKAFRSLFDCLTSPARPSTEVANERCEALIAAVRDDEREQCAKVADNYKERMQKPVSTWPSVYAHRVTKASGAHEVAKLIRARGAK